MRLALPISSRAFIDLLTQCDDEAAVLEAYEKWEQSPMMVLDIFTAREYDPYAAAESLRRLRAERWGDELGEGRDSSLPPTLTMHQRDLARFLAVWHFPILMHRGMECDWDRDEVPLFFEDFAQMPFFASKMIGQFTDEELVVMIRESGYIWYRPFQTALVNSGRIQNLSPELQKQIDWDTIHVPDDLRRLSQ